MAKDNEKLEMIDFDVIDFDESVGEFVRCEYTERQAYCLTNQINTKECAGRKGKRGDECKYFKLIEKLTEGK